VSLILLSLTWTTSCKTKCFKFAQFFKDVSFIFSDHFRLSIYIRKYGKCCSCQLVSIPVLSTLSTKNQFVKKFKLQFIENPTRCNEIRQNFTEKSRAWNDLC
jgi:hypothetical protein